jgi:hypothetical protein
LIGEFAQSADGTYQTSNENLVYYPVADSARAVATVSVVAVVGAGILVYFTKIKKKKEP